MKKLNALFITYLVISLIYVGIGASETGFKAFILVASGWLSCCVSAVGYSLNGGK